ncbi:hypothetical protein [Micromonospora sp. WMMD1219]|uniref:hypothetical protein n=1 Tax=Micromonospora sp. WMMD1219 TaxID=3404115 RepID=UPI003BF5A6A9
MPEKPFLEAIFEANKKGELRNWQEKGESIAQSLVGKAERAANPQERARYLLESVLHREFWLEGQALGAAKGKPDSGQSTVLSPAGGGHGASIPLTPIAPGSSTAVDRDGFIPLVRMILDPSAAQVTDEHMAKLRTYANEAYEDELVPKPVGLDALRRAHGYAALGIELEKMVEPGKLTAKIKRKVERFTRSLNESALYGTYRAYELRSLVLHLLGKENNVSERMYDGIIRHANQFLDWAHRRYLKTVGNFSPGPLSWQVLHDLISDKLGPGASLRLWEVEYIGPRSNARQAWWQRHSAVRREVVGRVASAPGLGMVAKPASALHAKRIAREFDDGDTPRARNLEVAALRALLEAAPPSASVSVKDLERLVAIRREFYAKEWDRRYTSEGGLSHYGQMAQELLGRGQVTPAVLRELAAMAHSEAPLRFGGVNERFNHNKVRKEITDKALQKWQPGTVKPGPRPNLLGDGQDHSRMVTAFHTIDVQQRDIADLTAWVNRSVPFADAQITEDVLRGKIESLFGQTLDDGSPLEIVVDDTTYDIRLWAIPVRGPQVELKSLPAQSGLFAGALEGRTYNFFERADWSTRMDGIFFDFGFAHRFLAGVRHDLTATYGQSNGSGRRVLASNTTARYQQVRVKENMGWAGLDVNWVLRIQERRTYHRRRDAVAEVKGVSRAVNALREETLPGSGDGGRWTERVFTDQNGAAVTHTIRYAVPEFNLPYSLAQAKSEELKEKTDPDYRKTISITDPEQFPVWRIDHAVTRVQVADQVIAGVRDILKPEDYAFWKTYVERYLSNDELALQFANLVRPRKERSYQQTFRVVLQSNGRRLSFSIVAKGDRPISTVTKSSQVSTSGETRMDVVRASVKRIQVTQNQDSTHRFTVNELVRFPASRFGRAGGRFSKPFGHKNDQYSQQTRTFTTRATRVVDQLQVAVIDFDLELQLHHHHGSESYSDVRDLSGYAHVMVHKTDFGNLSGVGTSPSSKPAITIDENPAPRWWTPGPGWGITMDVVDRLGGVERLYNEIVPRLVDSGHLPEAARAAPGAATTPWDILQALPSTGETVNRPGLAYRNWQTLIDQLSEESLLPRADEVLGSSVDIPGIVWTFPHPRSPVRMEDAVTVSLAAEIVKSEFKEDTVYELQYGHMNTEATTLKDAKVSAVEAGLSAGAGANIKASMQLTANAQYGSRKSENSGQTQSSSLLSDTDGQKMKSRRFTLTFDWHWSIKPAGPADTRKRIYPPTPSIADRTFQGTFAAEASVLQPGVLNDDGSKDALDGTGRIPDLGRLVVEPATDGNAPRATDNLSVDFMKRALNDPALQSPITQMNASAYTVIGTWGAGRLRTAAEQAALAERERVFATKKSRWFTQAVEYVDSDPMKRSQQLHVFLATALSRQAYNGALLRALTGASVAIPLGDQLMDLRAVLVGTPEILQSWKPYTQQVTEAQAGKESGAEGRYQAGFGAGGFVGKSGFKPVIADAPKSDAGNSEVAIGSFGYTLLHGRGQVSGTSSTVGKYSGLFQDDFFVLVRSAVVHQIRVGQSVRWVAGEVLLNMKSTDVLPYAALFTDKNKALADQVAKVGEKITPPPAAAMTSTVRPSGGHKRSPQGVTLWQMLLSGGSEQTGFASLVKELASAARAHDSDELATYVTSVPSLMNPFMGKALDGGATMPFRSSDSRTFMIVLQAELVGPASGSHDSGSGTKSYTRRNDADFGSRLFDHGHSWTVGVGAMGRPTAPEDATDPKGFEGGLVAGALAHGRSRTTGRSDIQGSNLLTMKGVRANDLLGYYQNVRFFGSIEETTPPGTREKLKNFVLAATPAALGVAGEARKVQEFSATVRLLFNEPRGGSTALGAEERSLNFGLRQALPAGASVASVYGLADLHAAITAEKGLSLVKPNDTSGELRYETLPESLSKMLTDEGAKFKSLLTGMGHLGAGPKGFVVRARFAEVENLYWLEKSEIEKYKHGTDIFGQAARDSIRTNTGVSATVAVPVDPVHWLGVTVSGGRQASTTTGADQVRSNEHRAWVRITGPLFVLQARLHFYVEWPKGNGTAKIQSIGSTEMLLSKEDARALGIPDDTLAAAVPAANRAKQFPRYAERADRLSTAPRAAAHRLHTAVRLQEAGAFAAQPPPGIVSRVDITNYFLLPNGSGHPVVWYEITRSDKELIFVLRVHLTGHPDAVAKVKNLTKKGVQSHLNDPKHRLPMAGRQLRVDVQFVDAERAHMEVPVVSADVDLARAWVSGQSPAYYALKVLRAIGAADRQLPRDEGAAGPSRLVRPADLRQIMDVLEPMWPWRAVPGAALVRPGAAQGGDAVGPTGVLQEGGSDVGEVSDLDVGGGVLDTEPDWLRMSLAAMVPDAEIPNLLSDMPVTGGKSQAPPPDLQAVASRQPQQYFIWLSTARGAAVDRRVLGWLNERLEQLAHAGRTPIVVTRGRPELNTPGGSQSVPGEPRSLIELIKMYGAAVMHEVPRSSGLAGGLNFGNSWAAKGAIPASTVGRDENATWERINPAVVAAARSLTRPIVSRVSELFGRLVWDTPDVGGQFSLLKSRWADLQDPAYQAQAAEMAKRVPTSMKIALVRPLLRFGPDDNFVAAFTASPPEKQSKTLLQAVTRLEEGGKLDPHRSGDAIGDFIDVVQAARLGADEAEHDRFDFTVAVLKAIAQVKARNFTGATQFIEENTGRLSGEQKHILVEELGALHAVMTDADEGVQLEAVQSAVLNC